MEIVIMEDILQCFILACSYVYMNINELVFAVLNISITCTYALEKKYFEEIHQYEFVVSRYTNIFPSLPTSFKFHWTWWVWLFILQWEAME